MISLCVMFFLPTTDSAVLKQMLLMLLMYIYFWLRAVGPNVTNVCVVTPVGS